MSAKFEQSTSAGATATSVQATFSVNVKAGSTLVATTRIDTEAGITSSISDSLNGAWPARDMAQVETVDVHRSEIFKFYNTVAGVCTVTLSISGGVGHVLGLTILEYSGTLTTDPLDVTAGNQGADASVECGPVTMTKGGVIVTGWGYSFNQTTTLDADYAHLEQNTTGRLGSADRVTAAITDTAVHTASAANDWSSVTATYKEGPVPGAVIDYTAFPKPLIAERAQGVS